MSAVLWVPIGFILLLAVVGVWAAYYYGSVKRRGPD